MLFLRSEVVFRLLHKHPEGVNCLPCPNEIELRLPPLLMHQTELQHAGHVEGSEESLEGDFQFLCRMAARLYLPIHFSRRFAISIGLLLLFCSGGSRRDGVVFGGRLGGFLRGGQWFWGELLLFFGNVLTQLA